MLRDDWRLSGKQSVSCALINRLRTSCVVDQSTVLIAAYATALWVTEGRKESTVVLAFEDGQAYPIRLLVRPSAKFHELAQEMQSKIEAAGAHRRLALPVLMNIRSMPTSIVSHSVFNIAYLELELMPRIEDRLRFPASGYGGLNLILAVRPDEDVLALQFIYSSGGREFKAIEKLGLTLTRILKAAAEDSEAGIYQLGANEHAIKPVLSPDQAPRFAF
ncbi:MAG TPA: hypothetical protein VKB86_18330 [Pyrinomonadaceae bacterium]|nr:hypothetical protein [Pyrinomonadaceae bacterium]